MLKQTFAHLVDELADACRVVYGNRLTGIILFGSVALDRMNRDSDVDLLIEADPIPTGRLAQMKEFDLTEKMLSTTLAEARAAGINTRLAPILRRFEDLDNSGFLIFDIACDGKVLVDTDGKLEQYLAGVRKKLEDRGAQRRTLRGAKYWVLDPNVRPGQVITL